MAKLTQHHQPDLYQPTVRAILSHGLVEIALINLSSCWVNSMVWSVLVLARPLNILNGDDTANLYITMKPIVIAPKGTLITCWSAKSSPWRHLKGKDQ